MKRICLRYSSLLILLCLIFQVHLTAFSLPLNQDESECLFNKKTAWLIGKIYVLSDPMNDPNELVILVKEYPEYFQEDGLLVKSTHMLGTWLLEQKKSSINLESILEVKNKLADCRISEEYAIELLARLKESDIDFMDLGHELIRLSEVLPCLVRGDLKTYLCTQTNTRKECRKIISRYKCIHISDPEVAEIITEDTHCFQQLAGDQISLLAIISKL